MKISTSRVLVLALTAAFAQPTFAREVKFDKKIDVGALQAQLIAAGFKVSYIECSVTHCMITMPDSEKKDPMPEVRKYVYVDARELRVKKMAEMQALYDKWEAGTISDEDKDKLIKGVLGTVLGR